MPTAIIRMLSGRHGKKLFLLHSVINFAIAQILKSWLLLLVINFTH